jgi:hypothetical protein
VIYTQVLFARLIPPGSVSILAVKAAEIAPCPYFDKEALILSPQIGPFRHFRCKTGPGGGEKRANGPKNADSIKIKGNG